MYFPYIQSFLNKKKFSFPFSPLLFFTLVKIVPFWDPGHIYCQNLMKFGMVDCINIIQRENGRLSAADTGDRQKFGFAGYVFFTRFRPFGIDFGKKKISVRMVKKLSQIFGNFSKAKFLQEVRRIKLEPSSFAQGGPEGVCFSYIQSFLPLNFFCSQFPNRCKDMYRYGTAHCDIIMAFDVLRYVYIYTKFLHILNIR